MLFMVIEHFQGNQRAIGERFRSKGRMMPPGVEYLGSWIDPVAHRCFQVMRAPTEGLLRQWIANWQDLVRFEVVPVLTSPEYWNSMESTG